MIERSPAVRNDSGAQRWPVGHIGPSDWSRLQGQGSWARWNFGLGSPYYTCPRRKCQHMGIHNHQPIRNSLLDILSLRGIQRALSLRMPVQSCHLSPIFMQENMRWGEGGADEAMGPSIIDRPEEVTEGLVPGAASPCDCECPSGLDWEVSAPGKGARWGWSTKQELWGVGSLCFFCPLPAACQRFFWALGL